MNDTARQRAEIYRFLGRLFRTEVDAETLLRLKAVRFPENGPWGAAGADWNRCAAALTGDDLELLAVDYARVFLGAGLAEAAAAFPYESVYTSPKRIVMQDAWSQMRALLRRRRLELAAAAPDLMEDHIAVELAYMARLCGTADAREQAAFLDLHLQNWAPRFCADVERYAETAFYRAAAALTRAFLAYDAALLKQFAEQPAAAEAAPPAAAAETTRESVSMTKAEFDRVFARLREEYDIYGPAVSAGRGTESETTSVRFRNIESPDEIVNDRQSDFSAKEVYYPISQTLFRFDENEYQAALPAREKPALIFAHPCDINAIRRLDNIFLKNGGRADPYYEALRSKVKFALLECNGGYSGCWCVSMGTNKTDGYSLAVRLGGGVQAQIADAAFLPYFKDAPACEYAPAFVEENARAAKLPRVADVKELQTVFDLGFWKDYNDRCISCGGCNTVCPTCSCYETADYLDQENSRKGERRRVWASCMLPEFTRTAGGEIARPTPDKMMRFKALHKVFDYKARFGSGEHMCVGCGRCVLRCPKDIDFLDTIDRLHGEVERLIAQQEETP